VQELDRAFKAFVALQPNCMLDLLFGKERNVLLKEITDPQINLPELRGDKALIVEENGEERYLLLEAMVHPEPDKLSTFALKALGIQYVQRRKTVVVIIYLEKGRYASFPSGFENCAGGFANQYQLARVLLWEHEDRILSGELKEFAPFLALFHEQPDPAIIDTQKDLLGQIADLKLQSDLLAIAMVVDARSFGYKVVLEKFKKEVNMLKETSIVQEWLDERYNDGKLSGKIEGKIEGKRALLQTLLTQRFGYLTPELINKLQLSSNEQLDRLGAVVLSLNSLEELQAWLSNGAAGHGVN
jgi:predicted transposase YdaD